MTLYQNLLTIGILLALGLIIYLKMTHKTIPEFIKELKEAFSSTEEVTGG